MSDEDRLERGERAFADGNVRAAILDAKDVLRDQPDNARGRALLGRAFAEVGEGASAEKELREAIELGIRREAVIVPLARGLLLQRKFQEIVDEVQPDVASSPAEKIDLQLVRGDAFMGLGQPVVARELYRKVVAESPENIGAHLGIVSSFQAENDLASARRTIDHITTEFGDDVRGLLASAELHLGQLSFAEASEVFERASSLAAANNNRAAEAQALLGLAESQIALQNNDAARASIARVAELAPNSLQALFLVSRLAFLEEDLGTAQSNLHRILQRAPEFMPAQTMLGAVHLRNGNFSQAEMYLSAVVATAPDNNQARRLLAETHLQMHDAREARTTLAPLVSTEEPDPADLVLLARASLSQGDVDAAIDYLRRSIVEQPGNVDAQFRLAIALMNAGRYDEFAETLDAIDVGVSPQDEFRRNLLAAMSAARSGGLDQGLLAAQQLVADTPRNSDAHNLLGSVLAARGDIDSARKSFSTSLEFRPGDQVALRSLALLDEQEGKTGAARSRYELIVEGYPDATWAMLGIARIAAQNNDLVQSRLWLQRIRAVDANAVGPRLSLVAILVALAELDEAEVVVEEALRIDGQNAEVHDMLGRVRTGKGDHTGAGIAHKNALDLDAGNDRYRLNLASAQLRTGREDLAERTLNEDGRVNLDHMPSAVAVASLKVDKGDLVGALQIAQALQDRYPTSPVPHALQAEIQVRGGRLEEAVAAYNRALSVDVMRSHAIRAHRVKTELGHSDRLEPIRAWLAKEPLDSDARLILAESLQADALTEESIVEYLAVIEQDPDNGIALNNLAWMYYLTEDRRAVETARKAFAVMPDSGSAADTLGWILVETKAVAEGVEVLRQAVELSNGRAEVRFHYAAGLIKLGNVDDARSILQEVVGGTEEFASLPEAERLLAGL